MFSCELPWPPSLNHATRHDARGVHYRSKAAKSFRSIASFIAAKEFRRLKLETITERCGIRIDLYPPNRHAFDVDGKVKEILDVLQVAGVYENDRLVRDVRILSHDDELRADGKCLIRLDVLHTSNVTPIAAQFQFPTLSDSVR